MKRFLIPAALLLIILLTAFGCGNTDNILAPESTTGNNVALSFNDEAGVWSEVAVLTAPKKGNGNNDPNGTLIGPAGGTVDAGNNSYLLVPEGALTEAITIDAKSLSSAIATNPGEIEQNLQDAITLIENQANYIQALPRKDDGSGVWIAKNVKNWLTQRNGYILEYANNGLLMHQAHNGWEALREISLSLGSLEDFEWDVDFQTEY